MTAMQVRGSGDDGGLEILSAMATQAGYQDGGMDFRARAVWSHWVVGNQSERKLVPGFHLSAAAHWVVGN